MKSLLSSDQLASSTADRYYWRTQFQAEKCGVFELNESLVSNRIEELWSSVCEYAGRVPDEFELAVLLAGFPKIKTPNVPMRNPWILSLIRRLHAL